MLENKFGAEAECVNNWFDALKSEDGNRYSIRKYLNNTGDYRGIASDLNGLRNDYDNLVKEHNRAAEFDRSFLKSNSIKFFSVLQLMIATATIATPLVMNTPYLSACATGGIVFGLMTWFKTGFKDYLEDRERLYSKLDWIHEDGELHIKALHEDIKNLEKYLDTLKTS